MFNWRLALGLMGLVISTVIVSYGIFWIAIPLFVLSFWLGIFPSLFKTN